MNYEVVTTGSLLQRSGLITRFLAQKGGKQNARPPLCRVKLLSLSICYHLSDIYTSTRSASQVCGGERSPFLSPKKGRGMAEKHGEDMKWARAMAINPISC